MLHTSGWQRECGCCLFVCLLACMCLLQRSGAVSVSTQLPSLINLTEDAQLSETLFYILQPGSTTVGNSRMLQGGGGGGGVESRSGCGHDIELSGALVAQDHW